MDMVPRISRAQKMDALSSMANVAGYRAVIEAGSNFGRFFTGQMTAAGKIPPAKVLVIGAGVAGLAAIGTAGLGAITYAFDVRPEVAEQIKSMGAQFVVPGFHRTAAGRRRQRRVRATLLAAVPGQAAREVRELAPSMGHRHHHGADPGREAPKLWLADMVAAMKPGVGDHRSCGRARWQLRAGPFPTGASSRPTASWSSGYTDFPSRMANQSSTLYATNIRHMMADLTPAKTGPSSMTCRTT